MHAHYVDDAYFEGGTAGYSSYQAQESTLRPTFRRFLAELDRRGMTGGRLLEVGCAYGFFLDEARGHFAHRTGTDYSPAALEKASSRADHVILGGTAELAAARSDRRTAARGTSRSTPRTRSTRTGRTTCCCCVCAPTTTARPRHWMTCSADII